MTSVAGSRHAHQGDKRSAFSNRVEAAGRQPRRSPQGRTNQGKRHKAFSMQMNKDEALVCSRSCRRPAVQPPPRQSLSALRHRPQNCGRKEIPMLDVIMLAIGLGFFALSVGYTIACDRL
jgi:hypothetical protein